MIHQLIDDLREFAEYAATHAQDSYLSLYLMTDPSDSANQVQTPAWRTFLNNAIANVESGLDPVQAKQWKNVRLSDESPDKAWARTRKRLEKYLTSYRPEGKTLVLFLSPGSEYSFELPVRIDSAYYYGKPHIQEFLWALDEYEQHSVLLFGEDHVRVLRLALGRSAADRSVVSDQAWLRGLRKTGEGEQNKQRQDDITRRFVKNAANEVDKFFMKTPDVGRIVLGGNMELAHAVLGSVHPSVKDKVIAMLPLPVELPAHEVADRIAETAEQGERDYEAALVTDIIRSAGARGRGATGYTAVGHALDRNAVRLLALPYPAESEIIEPILLQAVRAGTTVEFLHGEAAQRATEAGGIVAQLYYAIN